MPDVEKRVLVLDMTIRVEAVYNADLQEPGDKDLILSLLVDEKHRHGFIDEMVAQGAYWVERVEVLTRPTLAQDRLDAERSESK